MRKYVEKSKKRTRKFREEWYEKMLPEVFKDIDKQLDAKTCLDDEKKRALENGKKEYEKEIRQWKNKTLRTKKEKKMGHMMFGICMDPNIG